jgi:hypothetical protein
MVSLLRKSALALLLALYVAAATSQDVAVNDAGTWRTLTEIHVNDAGTWRSLIEVYVNDAGTWRLVFAAATVILGNITQSDTVVTPTNANIGFRLDADGDYSIEHGGGAYVDSGDWISPKTGMAGYDVRCTQTSGGFTTGTCDGVTWQNLGTDREWTQVRITDAPGFNQSQATVEIRRTSSGTIVKTITLDLTASVTS